MSAKPKEKTVIPIAQAPVSGDKNQTKSVDLLDRRATPEVVVAFMGAVGCGLARIITEFDDQLKALGYRVIRIKLSEFIKAQAKTGAISISAEEASVAYLTNQSGGNQLREAHGCEVLAQFAISQISRHRLAIDKECSDLAKAPPRVAYLVDQIKHPEEVHLFRMVYRSAFYLIGVMSTQDHRFSRLTDTGLRKEDIESIIARDRKESSKFGQQLEKAFKLADYFMHHPLGDQELIPEQTTRFINLVHGHNGITPTKHEHAMYVAHSTALKSSCLSRQVGAVITDKSDRIIAVGANDVPKYGGGLYSADHGHEYDDRCFNHRKVCENVAQKLLRKAQIKSGIEKELPTIFPDEKIQQAAMAKIDEIVELVFSESGIPDLIEFSRAVHAEMDALVSLSRGGGGSTIGGNLYTTTFPCHNCARHLVAAGIEKVYYIEPYEKSLAPEAHNDSIEVLDHDYNTENFPPLNKVKFIHFSGVGPRLYSDLFLRERGRKDDSGKLIEYSSTAQNPPNRIIKEYIDSYRTFETKIASIFVKEFPASDADSQAKQ
ncbi:MAG: hypothetical protein A0129_13510 [Limnobacter sp. CACIAM 66H1]|uniref:anti-phage dCTP deaminase n=1 Tax=Limnobacter sp. CACIAM 66H1 TaxID=1813033 RepID=UPI0007A80124|nr:anti-phage dCTP deaminase [Limnobacter sp. CACIAM 66H1]KYP10312.1 MAG: hypothetical protein A0129_13510 [Limnobacter sp. CACIAM 66H1]